ncbi:alkyl hydroperoxide reductase/ Thiol specific antioxidant/ Mal allergen [Xylanimonas cellulosilytica DSM 15894]|uniref:Alkyl hydroperoxide reductase E n=1 Tax=Xylanimonas cellulosilytica (strain DSM 15894 / JCM 12276 / CECT 5975 / KCTC 9989 / LMG 20990 / NBRC 107835 / XIL07) TaxID=446471 RepID=D1BUD5_XYLCX|nr:peroxiredoxin [Xylanimonas cellulosilytica]ACZ31148.1 alkyl hydroperoxide reductase/ Thiol specific antioxidant/ Mal allergen [Xylanimonas cellulosilytica DSM 15894]
MALQPGEPAPDFTLQDTHGTPVHLADLLADGPVLLVFFPFAFSGICTGELCELRDNIEDFETAGVRLVAVSTDPVFTLKAWQQVEGYTFDLLSDFWPHGAVARAYGVLDEQNGHALRGTFLIDAGGVVRWSVTNPRGQRRDLQAYRTALAEI